MRAVRWLVPVVVGAAVLVGLFLLLRPDDEPEPVATPTPTMTGGTNTPTPVETPTETPTGQDALEVEIEVEEGRVEVEVEGQRQPGPAQVEAPPGQRISLRVEADVTDEVHVHGYDLLAEVTPDRPATITFRATIPGVFEIELEDAGQVLAQLEVNP